MRRAYSVALLLLGAVPTLAQTVSDTVVPERRSVAGKVQLARRSGPLPVAGAWVVVHRIVNDQQGKVGGGPLDSAKTDASGAFTVRYRYFGDATATYIALTTYAGVSYITSPLTRPRVTGDDAAIMVFDTTSPPYPIHVAGRHFVITAPDTEDRRRVIEVYELSNDSTLTVMGTEANPVWRAPLPPGVKDLQLNPAGDITPGTAKQVGDWLSVFAPISPGLRQLSFSYSLPAGDFPLSMPMIDSIGLFEVLVQEPGAVIDGAELTEVAPVVQEGMTFRRLLAHGVKMNAVVRFTMPAAASRFARNGVAIVAALLAAAMAIALVVAFQRRRMRPRPARAPRPVDAIDELVRELASMDASFEQRAVPTDADRATFTEKRAALKSRLVAALAARDGPS